MTYDLLLRGGTLVDGTGGEPFEADVGIEGDRIVAIGRLSGTAAEEIDARGKLVTPGFVDVHTQSKEDSIAAHARRAGVAPAELIYEVPLRRDGREILYRPMGNAEDDRFESSGRNLLKTDLTVLGLGDGGAHYSLICDAAYPTYLLTYWTRDATPDRRLPLPWAIKKLCHEPAAAIELHDRGLLRLGYKADLNVIDFDRLHLHAPHATYDLPGGARRLSQKARGYEATIVSGQITYREGQATGALPGRLVRGGQHIH